MSTMFFRNGKSADRGAGVASLIWLTGKTLLVLADLEHTHAPVHILTQALFRDTEQG